VNLLTGSTRLLIAALIGLLVFATTYLACWVAIGNATQMDYRSWIIAQGEMHHILEMLSAYVEERGENPDSLDQLVALDGSAVTHGGSDVVLDPWGNAYRYMKTDGGFELSSLGRDGTLGGIGFDADIYVESATFAERRLPLSQFLFEGAGSGIVFLTALVASLCAGAASCLSTDPRRDERLPRTQLLARLVGQSVSAVIVAVLLAAFHVMASQSGH
jgi:hypothetical protein